MKIVNTNKCDCCGKEKSELMQFGVWLMSIRICQGCVSQAMRMFSKNK